MKNAYKIMVNKAPGSANTLTHDVPAPGSFWGPLKIKATPGARYQLVDVNTGQGPDNIRVKRVGKDLRISFEGRDKVDVMITDYYEQAGHESLVGEVEAGVLHPYVPESGESSQMLSRLADGANSTGMALGNEPLAASGAAAAALVAAAGFNPLLAAPLALLVAAGGGGGGGGGGGAVSAPPQVRGAKLHTEDDTGVSNSDGITSDKTPRLLIDADANAASATVTVNGKSYTSTTKNAQGQFVVQIPDGDELPDGEVNFSVVVKDAAGRPSESIAGTQFVVDTSATDNYNPAKESDPNQGVSVQIVSIDADTGVSSADFVTSDNTLTFQGTVANAFVKNGDFVELQLRDATGKLVASQYVEPVNNGGQWRWAWDHSKQALADGTYKLTALVVDKAGNAVGAGPVAQAITIDTNATPDPNSKFSIAVTQLVQDSGASASDFLTNQRNLSFKGHIGDSHTGFTGKVLVQVVGTDGKVISQGYVTPAQDGTWSYDNSSQPLGQLGKNTQYLLNASIVDLAGNVLKSTDQSFTVDLQLPAFTVGGGFFTDNKTVFASMQLNPGNSEVAAEAGTFVHTLIPSTGAISAFNAGDFSITFTDLAGNSSTISNSLRWEFQPGAPITKTTTDLSPPTFGSGELAGSIGTYILGPNEMDLDLSTLHSTSPQLGDLAAINHIGLSGGGVNNVANADHVLTVTTSDVLVLGVKNSFVSNDRQQLRIDGDVGDKVMLDDLLDGSEYAWSKASSPLQLNSGNYHVYSNASLELDLFIQQGIQIQTSPVL
jgi:hypothetical protein